MTSLHTRLAAISSDLLPVSAPRKIPQPYCRPKVALASAVIGTAAAPMIFELPFDLIVMARTNPPIPTHPMLYRQLFFLPLFLVELSTISLLTLLPSMRVTAYACYAVAGMFALFAIWAAFGFAFPSQPLPLALNVISKILCFVAAIMLFAWGGDKASECRMSGVESKYSNEQR